jgi:glyoxylase-like metal-dependent hydrolase (beta-lactamase superfamily II)
LSPTTKYYKSSPNNDDGLQLDIQDGQVFKVEGATLRAVHTPGHTIDHMCFVLEEEDAIFTGDNVLGHGTSVFEDLGAYMGSLQKMLDQGTKGVAYPGHGAVVESSGRKINEYILHRKRREDQTLGVLRDSLQKGKMDGNEGNESLGVMEIVDEIYPSIDSELALAAGRGIVQVLKKLEAEGRVGMREHASETKWFLRESL